MNSVIVTSSDGKHILSISSFLERDEITVGVKAYATFPKGENKQYRTQFFNRGKDSWLFVGTHGNQILIDLKNKKSYTSNHGGDWFAISPNPSGTILAVDCIYVECGILDFYDFSDPEQGLKKIPRGKISQSYELEITSFYNSYEIKWLDDNSMEYINTTDWCISRNECYSDIGWEEWNKIPKDDIETRRQYRTVWSLKDSKMRCIIIEPSEIYKERIQCDLEMEADQNAFLKRIKTENPQFLALKREFGKIKPHTCANDRGLIRSSTIPIEEAHFGVHVKPMTVQCFPNKIVVMRFDVWPNTTTVFPSIEEAIVFIKI